MYKTETKTAFSQRNTGKGGFSLDILWTAPYIIDIKKTNDSEVPPYRVEKSSVKGGFMYYRLKEPWAFRGLKKLPFAICAMAGKEKHDEPFLMEKVPFLDLLCCNGEEDVDTSTFSEAGRHILGELTANGIVEQSDTPMKPLSSFQRYRVYPGRRLKSVHWSITGKCNFNCRHCLVPLICYLIITTF